MIDKELPSVSVVVRSRNEENTIKNTLSAIASQSLEPSQIILVDNDSQDRTVELAFPFCSTVVKIDGRLIYNHAYASNLGVSQAMGEVVVVTNGHTLPLSNQWLEKGIRHFTDPEVAGVSGYQYPSSPSLLNRVRLEVLKRLAPPGKQSTSFFRSMGLFSTVCGAIRRNLWEQHPFDETFSSRFSGGEDKDWAFYFQDQGFKFIVEPDFSVSHSHRAPFKQALLRDFDYLLMYAAAYKRLKMNTGKDKTEFNYFITPYEQNTRPWRPWMNDALPLIEMLQDNSFPLESRGANLGHLEGGLSGLT